MQVHQATVEALAQRVFMEVFTPKAKVLEEPQAEGMDSLEMVANWKPMEFVARIDEEILACATRGLKIIQQALQELEQL